MEDGLKLGKRHDTPNIQIDYQKETLTGFDSSATYTINGETVTTAEDNTITIQEGWFGTSISIVKKGSEDISDSEAQSLVIPARPGAPAVTGDVNRIDGATTAYGIQHRPWRDLASLHRGNCCKHQRGYLPGALSGH